MAAKVFEVSDVLPATTQLRIYIGGITGYDGFTTNYIYSNESSYETGGFYMRVDQLDPDFDLVIYVGGILVFEYNSYNPVEYVTIDTSLLNVNERTIQYNNFYEYWSVTWEDVAPPGYTITFNSNGGTTFSDIEEATELPTLPIPTKSGYTFVAWYYESNFQTRAKAGDTIESNVTLYAKWHNLGSLFTEIADAIRSKDGTSENIRDVDFGERVKQIQGAKEEETKTVTPNFASGNVVVTPTSGKVLSQVTINKDANFIAENLKKDVTAFGITGTSYIAIELTQAQYDALETKDANTYYLIVEVE